jgi:hypothetical protein
MIDQLAMAEYDSYQGAYLYLLFFTSLSCILMLI